MNALATIESVERIYEHPNADSLEFVEVKRCQVIVPKAQFALGEKIVFIWPDSVLPEAAWTERYRAKSSRVKAVRLRGEYSMGIAVKLETFTCPDGDAQLADLSTYPIGSDVSTLIGVTKYDPPPPKDLSARGNLPFGIPKTDETNHYHLAELPYGWPCTVTRKRDGSSASFYYHLESDSFGAMSRSLELKTECHNAWTQHISQYNIQEKLTNYCKKHKISLCLRGESFGVGRNNHKANVDAKTGPRWEVFGVWDIKSMRQIAINEPHNFIDLAEECGLSHVPILERCILTKDLIDKYQNEPIGFEGVVVHCAGRTFKIINKEYDSRK